MKTFSTICVVAITFACLASTCSAQGPLYHSSPYFAPPVPQYPVIVTQPQFNGYTPWGYNTYNEQIDNTLHLTRMSRRDTMLVEK